jgi:hypothetical protein
LVLREKYQTVPAIERIEGKAGSEYSVEWRDGVMNISTGGIQLPPPPSYAEFEKDLQWLKDTAGDDKQMETFARQRLEMLDLQYDFHRLANSIYEQEEIKGTANDFNSVPKVDNHIHAAAAMTGQEFLSFLRRKFQEDGDEVVVCKKTKQLDEDGIEEEWEERLTLSQLITRHDQVGPEGPKMGAGDGGSGGMCCFKKGEGESVDGGGLPSSRRQSDLWLAKKLHAEQAASHLTADRLGMQAEKAKVFRRFDNFNDTYNPMADQDLRTVFLKTSNLQGGKYFAELLQLVADRVRTSQFNEYIEPRLSIYGNAIKGWADLAHWAVHNKLVPLVLPAAPVPAAAAAAASNPDDYEPEPEGGTSSHVRYMIQIPRLFGIFATGGKVVTFEELLRNIFQPMVDATLRPEEHPELHAFLAQIGGIDCVDDESSADALLEGWVLPEGGGKAQEVGGGGSEEEQLARLLQQEGAGGARVAGLGTRRSERAPTPAEFTGVTTESEADARRSGYAAPRNSFARTPRKGFGSVGKKARNPCYSYYLYYLYANLRALNSLREARGMNTLSFKPHCGEAGPGHHLCTGFLLAESINHGIMLERGEGQVRQPTR